MTTAPAADQVRLLEVQQLDTHLARLAHRRATLPEQAQLDDVRARLGVLADELVSAQTTSTDLARELRKAEEDVALVRARIGRDNDRLAAGQGSAKDLQGTQHELASLARRQAELEDVELEVMERVEAVRLEEERVSTQIAQLQAAREALAARLAGVLAEVDAETAEVSSRREQAAAGLDAGLTDLYDRLRAAAGGVGAAPLLAGRCEGCRLELSPVELGRIRTAPADEVLRCEECRRILVRPGAQP